MGVSQAGCEVVGEEAASDAEGDCVGDVPGVEVGQGLGEEEAGGADGDSEPVGDGADAVALGEEGEHVGRPGGGYVGAAISGFGRSGHSPLITASGSRFSPAFSERSHCWNDAACSAAH